MENYFKILGYGIAVLTLCALLYIIFISFQHRRIHTVKTLKVLSFYFFLMCPILFASNLILKKHNNYLDNIITDYINISIQYKNTEYLVIKDVQYDDKKGVIQANIDGKDDLLFGKFTILKGFVHEPVLLLKQLPDELNPSLIGIYGEVILLLPE